MGVVTVAISCLRVCCAWYKSVQLDAIWWRKDLEFDFTCVRAYFKFASVSE